MRAATDISPTIIDALITEALATSEQVRRVFNLGAVQSAGDQYAGGQSAQNNPTQIQSGQHLSEQADDSAVRMAMSVEGLRATTRVMHVLAWLLNYRAYFDGELTQLQLRRHSRLPVDRPSEPQNLAVLEMSIQALIDETQKLHARISRLDKAWREEFNIQAPAVHRLRQRIGLSLV